MDITFDQYQRYKTAQLFLLQIKRLAGSSRLKILEVGANEQFNLEKMMPDEDIYYVDIHVPDYLKQNKKYIEADACDLKNISDNEFDVVVGLDIFEHIPHEKKAMFLKEVNRVSNFYALISAPFGSQSVCTAEKRANEFFRALTAKDHLWLKEHIDLKLPDFEETESILNDYEIQNFPFRHGRLDIWENMISVFFMSYARPELTPYRQLIEQYYNGSLYFHDVGNDCYRTFLLMSKNGNKTFGSVSEIGANVAALFDPSGDETGARFISDLKSNIMLVLQTLTLNEFGFIKAENNAKAQNEIKSLREANEELGRRCGKLEEAYKKVVGSKSWKFTKPLRRIMRMFG